jgi:malic enzyme
LPLGATLAAATEAFPEVVLAATLAVARAAVPHAEAASQAAALPVLHTEAALLEVASRVAVDMVVDGIKRQAG